MAARFLPKWRPKFSIASLLFLIVTVAVCLAWTIDNHRLRLAQSDLQQAGRERRALQRVIDQQLEEMGDLRVAAIVGPGYWDRHTLGSAGQFDEVLAIYQKVLPACREVYGSDHFRTRYAGFQVGVFLCLTNQHGTAEPYLLDFIEQAREAKVDFHSRGSFGFPRRDSAKARKAG